MKRTSILLTVLLVVSLLFAVSCPNKDPSINVTSDRSAIEKNLQDVDKNIPFVVMIDIAHDTFSDKVATDANVIDWFTLSDGTEAEKATLKSATINSVSEKKDSVTIKLVAEAKAVTEADKPIKLTVAIPEATTDVVWTNSKKAIKEVKANNIAITIVNNGDTPTPPASKKVTGKVSDETIEFTESTVSTDEKSFKITLENGEFVNENDVVITGNGVTSGHISFAKTIDSNNKNVLNVSVSATEAVSATDGGDYTITVKASAIKASSDYTAEEIVLTKSIAVKEGNFVKLQVEKGDLKLNLKKETLYRKEDNTQKEYKISVKNGRFTGSNSFVYPEGYTKKDTLTTSKRLDENIFTYNIEVVKTDLEPDDSGSFTAFFAVTPDDGYSVPGGAKTLSVTFQITVED